MPDIRKSHQASISIISLNVGFSCTFLFKSSGEGLIQDIWFKFSELRKLEGMTPYSCRPYLVGMGDSGNNRPKLK